MSLFTTSGGKAAKFPQPGASITGRVGQSPYEKPATKFGTQEADFWPNGDPKVDIVVPLEQTNAELEAADDDGARTIYVSSGKMKKAIADAMRDSGATDILVGGTLTVTFTGFDPMSKNPANPAKLYAAQYTQPTSPLAQPAAAAAPAAAMPAPVAAPQQQWVQPVAQQQWAAPAAPPAAPVQQPVAAPIPQQPAPAAAPPAMAAPAAAPTATTLAEFIGVTEEQFGKAKQLLTLGTIPAEGIAAALSITPEQVAGIAAS